MILRSLLLLLLPMQLFAAALPQSAMPRAATPELNQAFIQAGQAIYLRRC